MLKHLKRLIAFIDSADSTENGNAAVMSSMLTVSEKSVPNPAASVTNSCKDCSAETTSVSASLMSSPVLPAACGDLVTLPQGTSHLGFTFRLFASNGKLLAHFEDDLELHLQPGGGVCSVTRHPIGFHLPSDTNSADQKSISFLDQQYEPNMDQIHQNNSYFDRSHMQQHQQQFRNQQQPCLSSSNTHTSTSAASSAASSNLTLSTGKPASVSAADLRSYYFGSIHCLRLCMYPGAPPPQISSAAAAAAAAVAAAAAKAPSRKGGAQRKCNKLKAARRMRAVSRVSPLLREFDSQSGRTQPVGCVPSVSVAGPRRILTHQGGDRRNNGQFLLAHRQAQRQCLIRYDTA